VRKPIADCIGQYPVEAASERDDKVTDKSFELKSRDWKWIGIRLRNGKPTADVSGSILSLQPDTEALALIEPMVDTGRFGFHVWPKRVPKLGHAVQVFLRMKKPPQPSQAPTKSRSGFRNPAFEAQNSRSPFSFNSPGDTLNTPQLRILR